MQTSSGTSSSHDQDENHQGPGSHLASLAVAAEPFLKDAAVAQLLDASDAHEFNTVYLSMKLVTQPVVGELFMIPAIPGSYHII